MRIYPTLTLTALEQIADAQREYNWRHFDQSNPTERARACAFVVDKFRKLARPVLYDPTELPGAIVYHLVGQHSRRVRWDEVQSGVADYVKDNGTIVLEDGREVRLARLAAIFFPD